MDNFNQVNDEYVAEKSVIGEEEVAIKDLKKNAIQVDKDLKAAKKDLEKLNKEQAPRDSIRSKEKEIANLEAEMVAIQNKVNVRLRMIGDLQKSLEEKIEMVRQDPEKKVNIEAMNLNSYMRSYKELLRRFNVFDKEYNEKMRELSKNEIINNVIINFGRDNKFKENISRYLNAQPIVGVKGKGNRANNENKDKALDYICKELKVNKDDKDTRKLIEETLEGYKDFQNHISDEKAKENQNGSKKNRDTKSQKEKNKMEIVRKFLNSKKAELESQEPKLKEDIGKLKDSLEAQRKKLEQPRVLLEKHGIFIDVNGNLVENAKDNEKEKDNENTINPEIDEVREQKNVENSLSKRQPWYKRLFRKLKFWEKYKKVEENRDINAETVVVQPGVKHEEPKKSQIDEMREKLAIDKAFARTTLGKDAARKTREEEKDMEER